MVAVCGTATEWWWWVIHVYFVQKKLESCFVCLAESSTELIIHGQTHVGPLCTGCLCVEGYVTYKMTVLLFFQVFYYTCYSNLFLLLLYLPTAAAGVTLMELYSWTVSCAFGINACVTFSLSTVCYFSACVCLTFFYLVFIVVKSMLHFMYLMKGVVQISDCYYWPLFSA